MLLHFKINVLNKMFLVTLLVILTQVLFGQSTEPKDDEHVDHHHHHNEIGIANAPVYFLKEKIFAYGLHLHYTHALGHSKFALGLGYERIFDEHKHNTFGLVASYRPIDALCFNISPGLTFEDESESPNFAFHFETSYEIEFDNFHIGPVFEIAYDPEDIHVSLGLHVGYGF